jgi:glutaminase
VAEPEQELPQAVNLGVVARIVIDVYELCRADGSGELADYIPELAAAQPDSFALCLATADGRVYGAGESATSFTIQSISTVQRDQPRPGDRAPAQSDDQCGCHHRRVADHRPRSERIRRCHSRFAGRELTMNEAVYAAEARTGFRNRAIGYMLRSFGIIDSDPDEAVDRTWFPAWIRTIRADASSSTATPPPNGAKTSCSTITAPAGEPAGYGPLSLRDTRSDRIRRAP